MTRLVLELQLAPRQADVQAYLKFLRYVAPGFMQNISLGKKAFPCLHFFAGLESLLVVGLFLLHVTPVQALCVLHQTPVGRTAPSAVCMGLL